MIKIDITHIPPEGVPLNLECSSSQLLLDSEGIEFTKPLKVIAKLRKETDFIRLEGEIIVNLKLKCNHCLEDFFKESSYSLNLNLPLRKEDLFIDLTEDLRQEIILNHPFRIICSTTCKGLCPVCGNNLNKGACDCKPKS